MSTGEPGEGRQTQNSMPVCTEKEEGTQREAEVQCGQGVMENEGMSENRAETGQWS